MAWSNVNHYDYRIWKEEGNLKDNKINFMVNKILEKRYITVKYTFHDRIN